MAKSRKTRRNKQSPDAKELLVLELQEIHSAERQLAGVLPRLSKVVESDTLRSMLDDRLEEGERIIKDIESVFDELEESPGRKKNIAAQGLIDDAREHVQEIEAGPALDAVLIGAIQKTEHYCIAAWGTARALARAVGQKDAASAMERALKEGGPFDQRLTQLAENELTPALLSGSEEESDDEELDDSVAATGARSRSERGSRKDQGANR